jgi:hypothetical protein
MIEALPLRYSNLTWLWDGHHLYLDMKIRPFIDYDSRFTVGGNYDLGIPHD